MDNVIDENNFSHFDTGSNSPIRSLMHWHKFIIRDGAKFEPEWVLTAILEEVEPLVLVSVKYTVDGNDAHFLARNCSAVIEKLLACKLQVNVPQRNMKVTIVIHLCYAPTEELVINIQKQLTLALGKVSAGGEVNLTAFHKHQDVASVAFVPLSITRYLLYVLELANKLTSIVKLNLSRNNIKSLANLSVLKNCPKLRVLDLQHNLIEKISDLEALQEVRSLEQLTLEHNPVCAVFSSPADYVKSVLYLLPMVRLLDGFDITAGYSVFPSYLCDTDAWPLVEQFLNYFAACDTDRATLRWWYNHDAVLTFTRNAMRTKVEEIRPYKSLARGHADVMELVRKQPAWLHATNTFNIDLLLHTEVMSVIVVAGKMQEKGTALYFTRTFVLTPVTGSEPQRYNITNDILHTDRAWDGATQVAFNPVVTPTATLET